MAFGHASVLRGFLRPDPDSNSPSTIDLHVHWKHFRRVFHRTNHGILPPTVDEPIGALCSSHFGSSFQPLSEFRQQMWISIASLDFPNEFSNFLYDQLLSFVIDFVAESLTALCPSLILVAEINFVHRVYDDYDPRPLQIIPPRQRASSADENSIPDTTTEGPELERHAIVFETFIPRGTTEGWGNDGGDSDSFFDIQGTLSEVDDDNNAGTEMLGRIERGEREMGGGGGEVNCSVCLDEFSEGQEVTTTACNHRYHEQCLLTWLNRNQICPLCRRPI